MKMVQALGNPNVSGMNKILFGVILINLLVQGLVSLFCIYLAYGLEDMLADRPQAIEWTLKGSIAMALVGFVAATILIGLKKNLMMPLIVLCLGVGSSVFLMLQCRRR